MSKELIISIGIPYSGRTTWLNKTYSQEGTVIIEEDKFTGLMKDGKVQESAFTLSNNWVTSEVKKLMESETPCERIVVSFYLSRPDHWRNVLALAVEHKYTVTIVNPKNGYLYYPSNKFGRNQEQLEWVKKSTISRFPKYNREKKKTADEEEVKENFNLYDNIAVEYMSAFHFYGQHKSTCETDPKKWLDQITIYYKPVITRTEIERQQREKEEKRQAELKAKQEKAKAEIEAKKAQIEAKKAELDAKKTEKIVTETQQSVVETSA